MPIFCVQEYNYLNLLCVKKNYGRGKTSNPLPNLPPPHTDTLLKVFFLLSIEEKNSKRCN